MAQHEEIVLWLDRRWKKAIEKHLKGETLQEHLETVLDELCNQLPQREYERISREIYAEDAANREAEEAARTYAAYHVVENGQEWYYKTTPGEELLAVGKKLRGYVTKGSGVAPDKFIGMFFDGQPITAKEFDALTALRMENTGKVRGVFDVNFDKREFSAVHIIDGWQTWAMRDVSVAVYHATRSQFASGDDMQTAKALLLERIRALETGAADDPGLVKELQELSQALAQVGGKHVYSYLPKSVKAQVDAIVERLAQLPEVAACYDQWWQLKDEIAGYYGQNTPPHQPLTQRKEFRSLKNWIIREAEDISFSPSADSTEPGEKQSTEKTPPIRGSVDVQPVGEAVSARHIPANVVMRLLHHMGQIFRTSMPVIPPALRIDSKRRRRLQEKRVALGHKRDDHEDEQLRHVNENTM